MINLNEMDTSCAGPSGRDMMVHTKMKSLNLEGDEEGDDYDDQDEKQE